MKYRNGSSGPLAGDNLEASEVGFNGSSPITLVSLQAPHEPGLYLLGINGFLRTAAASGTMSVSHSWSYPNVGLTSASRGSFSLVTPLGVIGFSVPLLVRSDGQAPILTSLTFASIVGSPLVDFSTTLELLALL